MINLIWDDKKIILYCLIVVWVGWQVLASWVASSGNPFLFVVDLFKSFWNQATNTITAGKEVVSGVSQVVTVAEPIAIDMVSEMHTLIQKAIVNQPDIVCNLVAIYVKLVNGIVSNPPIVVPVVIPTPTPVTTPDPVSQLVSAAGA